MKIDLRKSFGKFATGVTVIAARDGSNKLVGLTANSFTSVSLEPPLVLWSIRQESSMASVFDLGCDFIVNVLAADQIHIAKQLSKSVEDRFQGLSWTSTNNARLPIFEGCSAWFECRVAQRHIGGDHFIILGEILDYDASPNPPLLYFSGQYGTHQPHTAA